MKYQRLALGIMMFMAACAQPGEINDATSDSAEIMAAALEELITENHTFGAGPPPFTLFLIKDKTDPSAGSPEPKKTTVSRALTATERAVIEAAIQVYGPVRWIDDASEWQTDDLTPAEEGSVILGIGDPTFDGDTALVPVSLWCGGLCGTWLTYRLDRIDGSWQVTDIEGPVAIS